MLTIDGSQGEGGGQVLRTSLALSAITGTPFHIENIRKKRRNPGLAPQHLAGVKAVGQICHADIQGAALRATSLTFQPGGPVEAGHYTFDISQLAGQPSAGAVTLLMQSILLPLALADGTSRLILRGGTHVAWSPSVHYVQQVLLPTLARLGLVARLSLKSWGWYPKGGGEVQVTIEGPADLTGLNLIDRGVLVDVKGVGGASNLPSHIPQRISSRANNLIDEAGLSSNIRPERHSGPSTGAGIFLAAEYENSRAGFSILGEQGKPSEVVAAEGVEKLLAHYRSGQALDQYLPDQLLTALAMAKGPSALSTVEITMHTLTNAAIIGTFLTRQIEIEGSEGHPGIIRIKD